MTGQKSPLAEAVALLRTTIQKADAAGVGNGPLPKAIEVVLHSLGMHRAALDQAAKLILFFEDPNMDASKMAQEILVFKALANKARIQQKVDFKGLVQ